MSLYKAEADAEWLEERRRHRLSLIQQQRPQRLRDTGDLHPDVAAWGARLLTGTAGNLLLGGPTGSGKTWAAWEVLERAVAAGFEGRIMFAASAEWRDTIAPPVDRARLDQMRQADVLGLDDLGAGRVNEWELECLLGVVDDRWANGRPVVTTSNAQSLRATLGERIASRLADGATVVILDGADRRRSR
ncbi:ATP-binding protein [Actinomadura sp. NPDC049382]|uniref:ATP-binding protein n=1 Tax=Actinomadura sp. NPDC049382 TaxID=3158220 RepID=UPI0034215F13